MNNLMIYKERAMSQSKSDQKLKNISEILIDQKKEMIIPMELIQWILEKRWADNKNTPHPKGKYMNQCDTPQC